MSKRGLCAPNEPQLGNGTQTHLIEQSEFEPYMSPDVAEYQRNALNSHFDMSGFCDTSWPSINYHAIEPHAYCYDFGKDGGDGGQYQLGLSAFETPSVTDAVTPDSNCSSVCGDLAATESSGIVTTSDSSSRKRPQGEPNSYESDSDTDSRHSSTKKAKHSTNDLVFACPFFKRHPNKHRGCSKYLLKRVRDVKQHLNRNHRTPDYYCARCYCKFDSAKERDEHTRAANCEPRENPHFEGMTEEQKEQLALPNGRNKSPVERWLIIWEILFPGVEPPKSVNRWSPREEAVEVLRDIWTTRHSELLAELRQFETEPAIAAPDYVICTLVDKIFDILEAQSSTPVQPGRKSSKQQVQNTVAHDVRHMSPGGTLPFGESRDVGSVPLALTLSDDGYKK
ncbi:hypothetical protein PG984_015184 [Apiospora sp. TS-2023a]